jgi:hypothetical protein
MSSPHDFETVPSPRTAPVVEVTEDVRVRHVPGQTVTLIDTKTGQKIILTEVAARELIGHLFNMLS